MGKNGRPCEMRRLALRLRVISARAGEPEQAVEFGEQALAGARKSLPSLLMCSRELGSLLRKIDDKHPAIDSYLERLRILATPDR